MVGGPSWAARPPTSPTEAPGVSHDTRFTLFSGGSALGRLPLPPYFANPLLSAMSGAMHSCIHAGIEDTSFVAASLVRSLRRPCVKLHLSPLLRVSATPPFLTAPSSSACYRLRYIVDCSYCRTFIFSLAGSFVIHMCNCLV